MKKQKDKSKELLKQSSEDALEVLLESIPGSEEYSKMKEDAVELYKLRQEDEKIKATKAKTIVEAGLGVIAAVSAIVPAALNKVNMDHLIALEEGGKEIVSKAFQFISKGVR